MKTEQAVELQYPIENIIFLQYKGNILLIVSIMS